MSRNIFSFPTICAFRMNDYFSFWGFDSRFCAFWRKRIFSAKLLDKEAFGGYNLYERSVLTESTDMEENQHENRS
jgi:hypothetical protein